ncbi:MAG: hypothetical protein JW715_06000 [Sedimentisphaerales bacterium]|nr:hypothetical protein [Sedimentisphaerales bacterium]
MAESEKNSICKQAEQYYYDFLCHENTGQIPEKIIEHLNQCTTCGEKIKRLNTGLSANNRKESQNRRFSNAITDLLALHMVHIGNKVSCKTIRPFMPVILDPKFGIRIPTPITVHLDHCQQCTRDLETITNLNLSRTQLCRLSQLFADKTDDDSVGCRQTRAVIPAVLSMAFNKTNQQILRHLCKCENCRQALYEGREAVRQEQLHQEHSQQCSSCEKLTNREIFDYAIPYGLDPADNKSVIFGNSTTLHLQNCPVGLKKIQQLHRTIYGIMERDESEIATIYHIEEFAKTSQTDEAKNLYADYPISVEITTREDINNERPSSPIHSFAAARKKVPILNTHHLLKYGIIAVAVLMMAIAFLFRTSAAGALSINEFYAALEKANNVHISTFTPGETIPNQETWFSRPQNIFLMKTGDELTLWDFTKSRRTIKKPGLDSVQITQVRNDLNTQTEKTQKNSLGFMPFYSISDLPENAKWNQATDNEQIVSVKDTQVYDLSWKTKTYDGSPISCIARFTIDSYTNLPVNMKLYSKSEDETEYILTSIKTVEYIDDSEMQNVIEKYF